MIASLDEARRSPAPTAGLPLSPEEIHLRDVSRHALLKPSEAKRLGRELEARRREFRAALFESGLAVELAVGLMERVLRGERSFDRVFKLAGRRRGIVARRLRCLRDRLDAALARRRAAVDRHLRGALRAGRRAAGPWPGEPGPPFGMGGAGRLMASLRIEMRLVYGILDEVRDAVAGTARLDRRFRRRRRRARGSRAAREAAREWREAQVRLASTVPGAKRHLRRVERALVAYHAVREELFNSNQRLVLSIAKSYRNRGLPFLDLVQEGNVGLVTALDKFDAGRGHRLSTCSTWWIRQAMLRALADQSRTVRLPQHMVDALRRVQRERDRIALWEGREARPEDLAGPAGLTLGDMRILDVSLHETLSLDAPLGEGNQSVRGDLLVDERGPSPLDVCQARQLRRRLGEALERLPSREREILALRYGLDERMPLTLGELGRRFQVSRERIRQIEAKAVELLRSPEQRRRLEPFVEARDFN